MTVVVGVLVCGTMHGATRSSCAFPAAGGFVNTLCRPRVLRQLARRPSGTNHEFPAAVGADAIKHSARAVRAERAFESADASFGRIRR